VLHTEILKKSKNFIKQAKVKKQNFSENFNFFLCSWAECIGFVNLKILSNQKVPIIKKFLILFKENFSLKSHELFNDTKKLKKKKYESLVFSYFFPENLNKDGSYFDKYFSIKTKNFKKVLWVLVPLYSYKRSFKIQENIILLKKVNNKNFFFYLSSLMKSLFVIFCDFFLRKTIFFKNEKQKFASNLTEIIHNLLKIHNIKKVIYPYESQPHQNFFNKKIKLLNPRLKLIGYMHTTIPPLPLEYLKKGNEPDFLYVNGIDQKNILEKKLGWNGKNIKNISSPRYTKKITSPMTNKIFLPYYLEDINIFFDSFKKLIFSKPKLFFPKFEIRNHPSMRYSNSHLNLISKINFFLKKEKKYFKSTVSNRNLSVFFGSTAAVLEALERNVKVFHICSNVLFEKFDNFYWKSIKITNINKNVFEYKLLRRNNIIKIRKHSEKINLF
tara:strand:+ start:1613 stop:2938 length:1326 start_codon:yes stop_codon:yes gene_type:complete